MEVQDTMAQDPSEITSMQKASAISIAITVSHFNQLSAASFNFMQEVEAICLIFDAYPISASHKQTLYRVPKSSVYVQILNPSPAVKAVSFSSVQSTYFQHVARK